MGAVRSSLVAYCCSERDKDDDPPYKFEVKQTSRGSSATEKQRDDGPKEAVRFSETNDSKEKARVPSPKVQDYREVERHGRTFEFARNAADHSSQACAPVTAVVPFSEQQGNPCEPTQDSNGGALSSPLVLERTASDLEVPDPPLAAPESSQLSLGDIDDNSRLTQQPSKLDGEAKAPPGWHVNAISGLSEGLASKFQEQRNKEATGESAVGNIGEQRNSVFEPAQLEDKLACRFEEQRAKEVTGESAVGNNSEQRNSVFEPAQLEDKLACRFEEQRAKERAGTATVVVSVDGARAARRSDGIAVVDKVLCEKLAQQRLKADGH